MDREIPKNEMKRARRRKMLFVAGGALALCAAIWGVSALMAPSVKAGDITLAEVDKGTIQTSISASGKVAPAFEEIITSPIATRIVEIYRHAGDSVEAGTPLLRLDLQDAETELNRLADQMEMRRSENEQQQASNRTRLGDLRMQIEVKEMALERMEAELKNERYLDSLGSGTGDRVRQAELAVNTARLELKQMRSRLDNERKETDANLKVKNLEVSIAGKNMEQMRRTLTDAQVRAPRKATLTYINNEVGRKVAEGERIAIVADLSHFKVEGEIADSYADRLAVGADVMVKIGSERLKGKVTGVTPQSAGGTVAFTVQLEDDANPRLRSGQKTDVYVMTDVVEDAVRVKNGSFYTGPGEKEVFVMTSDNELTRRKVRFGDSSYEYVEVLEGLKPGERMVISDMKEYERRKALRIRDGGNKK